MSLFRYFALVWPAWLLLAYLLFGCAYGTSAPLPEPRPVDHCDARMVDRNRRSCAERGAEFAEPAPGAPCGRCAP